MLPSVAEVLALPELASSAPTVLAGRGHLDRPVRWVHAAEIADIAHLLRGGELVLTTGIALPSDDEGLTRYVHELADVGVAGLVVELGRRWERLPPSLVDACERAGCPLVALGRETRFAAVTQVVGERIVDAQLSELRAVHRIHEAFTQLSVSGADDAQILREIARLAGLPVVFESSRHHVLGYDAAGVDVGELLSRWEQRSRAVTVRGRSGYDDSVGWLVTEVAAHNHTWGRLVLLVPGQPTQRHVVLVERAASTLALLRLLARDRAGLERQTHSMLLQALCDPAGMDADLPQRCEAAGVPVRRRRLVGLVVMPPREHLTQVPGIGSAQLVRDLAEAASAAARDTGHRALVGILDDTAVGIVLTAGARSDADAATDELAEAVHRWASAASTGGPPVIAAGSLVERPEQVARSISEARQVAEAALRSPAGRGTHRLADVHVRGLVHLLGEDERMLAFAERELSALRDHDAKHASNLMEMLAHLLDHGGNKAAAAAAAHLSRPAYYDRLSRIERVLGVGLADAEVVTSLHLALLIDRGRHALPAADAAPSRTPSHR